MRMRTKRGSGPYYWIVGKTQSGQLVLWGWEETERDATMKGYQNFSCPFRIIPLPTRNRQRATGMIKAMRLDETHDLESSLERIRHGGET